MTLKELKFRQAWPLKQKIDHSLFTIETFLTRTQGKAYVAFSGGKDSTVLLDLVRIIDPNVPSVFVNTGNEYPDIIRFVRHLRDDLGYNIEEIHPKIKPREVWKRYGFPLVSKAQAEYIERFRRNPEYGRKQQAKAEANGWRYGKISDCWKYLISEPYATSNKCCEVLKKKPSNKWAEENGRWPIIGTMASESDLRQAEYLRRGSCNTFSEKQSGGIRSTPLAIWTDADIWEYIRERGLEIAEIYHKGVKRTGCVGCGFGCQFGGMYDTLYRLYPKYYAMIMNYTNNDVTFREAVRKVLAVKKYELPDESGEIFFED